MKNNEPELNGEWPDLDGKTLQGLFVQECWYQKDLEEEANVVLIKVEEAWHHFYFEMDILFCRTSQDEPHEGKPEEVAEISYRLRDLGAELDLVGRIINSCSARTIPRGSELELGFEGGRKISFKNIDNLTRYEII